MTQVVLTGATGFLGSEVLARALKVIPIEHIHILLRSRPDVEKSLLAIRLKEHGLSAIWPRLNFVQTNFEDQSTFKQALASLQSHLSLQDNSVVIAHLAAVIHDPNSDAKRQERINVGVTLDLLEWAKQIAVRRFVYTSSVVAFGGTVNQLLRNEDSFVEGLNVQSQRFDYYTSKRKAHELIISQSQVPTSVLCPGIVHGRLENFKNSRGHLKMLREKKLAMAPSGGGNIVGLDRVAAGIVEEILEQEQSQEKIKTRLLVDQNMTFGEYFQLYVDCALGRGSVQIRCLPAVFGKFASALFALFKKTRMNKIVKISALEGLGQATLFLWFVSKFKQPETLGVKKAIEDSLKPI